MAVAIVKTSSSARIVGDGSDVNVTVDHNGSVTIGQDNDTILLERDEAETLYETLGLLLDEG